ncbi:MAG: hypothetical protein MSH18_03695 [Bacteroidales bacterium]|nr:hypothetical protein [Bacteroidales bacterium]
MIISKAVSASNGGSIEMEVALSDLLPVSNLWCIADEFAKKIQWIYEKGGDTYAIFSDPDAIPSFEAVRLSRDENGKTELECLIIDLAEYIATSVHEFNSEREAIEHLVEHWDEAIVSRWDIIEEHP